MSKITYPCQTGVIFRNVIFPISIETKAHLGSELDASVRWFRRWFAVPEEVIRESLLVSFWGLYLTYEQSMERAA